MEDGESVPLPLAVRTSDLKVRTLSAVVMLAVAGGALWAGGLVLDGLIVLVFGVCFAELVRLVWRATGHWAMRFAGIAAGAAYIGYAASLLVRINAVSALLMIVGTVVFVDVFAYMFGRTLGGPKIAPSVSPSKTWAGLIGGAIGATTAGLIFVYVYGPGEPLPELPETMLEMFPSGVQIAVLAQLGDFFESWLKRKAGMKDSSNLIPGHGGVFDRIDGLLPVVILAGPALSQIAFAFP